MSRFRIQIFLMMFLMSVCFLSADQSGRAAIVYAEGEAFSIVSDDVKTSYRIGRDDVIGIPLKTGEVILTDNNSFLEISLNTGGLPGGGLIKIAENTTFTIDELEEKSGGAVFRVNYGRIRVKISSLLQGSRLWISGHDTVAGVRGTDFGYDLFYDRAGEGAERQTVVYCFDGQVDVLQFNSDTISKTDLMEREPYLLEASRMVTTTSADPSRKLRSRAIDSAILGYWELHPFISSLDMSGRPEVKPEVSEELSFGRSIDTEKGRFDTGGKIVFATGVGMMTLGGIIRAVAPESAGLSLGLLTVGGAAVLGGGGFLIYSISLP